MVWNVKQAINELIETLWNVNLFTNAFQGVATVELIETLWNVNFHDIRLRMLRNKELIETLWNVNDNNTTYNDATQSAN